MNTDLLKEILVDRNLLSSIIYFEELDSTNAYSKKHCSELRDNALVLTSFQTSGTGRFGRPWKSAKNQNLTFSLLKHYHLRVDEFHLMNFYTSYILYLTLHQITADYQKRELFLKWPNDLLLNRKKTAGILLDVKDMNSDIKKFIIGIGLNVNQAEFPEEINFKATSLKNEFRCDFIIEEILINFISLFYENLDMLNDSDLIMSLWKSKSHCAGSKVRFKKLQDGLESEVIIDDIENDGGLVVKDETGKKSKYYSGEISIIYEN
ncbi:MAG: biotin--[acetyl-CoA-carboxylase] ligase [Bacteroidetes bacterium]|nr:biotin--[acetyl-CoA-carboxylase] ligase [Bacteroidota bacterium]